MPESIETPPKIADAQTTTPQTSGISIFAVLWFAVWIAGTLLLATRVSEIPDSIRFQRTSSDITEEPVAGQSSPEATGDADLTTEVLNQFVPNGGVDSVHASSVTRLEDGKLVTVWFGGSREGARDVQIYCSRKSSETTDWSEPTAIATVEGTERELQRMVKKVGNPVLFRHSSGRVWLFYVTVSFGGWSGSHITCKYSDDGCDNWSPAERLVTSPFFNISTLVKGLPLELESGHIAIPTYHEFLSKFSELFVMTNEGRLVQKDRMTFRKKAIQPWVAPTSSETAMVFYRQGGNPEKKALVNYLSVPGECVTSPTQQLPIPNPNSALAVIPRHEGGFLMVCNPSDLDRRQLALMTSDDGLQWSLRKMIEDGGDGDEYSYPFVVTGPDDSYHLVYTWQRQKIRYLKFNDNWLEQD